MVAVVGLAEKFVKAGGVPHVEPFQLVPEGQTQTLPFQAWPPEQTLTQLEPFHVVPLAHGEWQVP